jgi:putative membrane protein
MLINGSRSRLATLAIVMLAVTACSKKESYGTDTTAASTTASPDTSAMVSGAPATPGNWTDENIFALLDEANMSDSAAGAVAATKGTASAIRDFGKQMMRDHHQLRARGEVLAKKLKITPAPPPDDPVMADAQKEMGTLNSTAKGKDFDKAYIELEVDGHKRVLELLVKAAQQTKNTQLTNLIQKAAPAVQGHLDKAEAIQKTLK